MENPTKSENELKLNVLNEQLLERIEQLQKLLEVSEQARTLAESRASELKARIAIHEESLQQFGANWFTPSSVTSLTYEAGAGVCLNGISIRMFEVTLPDDETAAFMATLAEQINRAKRVE